MPTFRIPSLRFKNAPVDPKVVQYYYRRFIRSIHMAILKRFNQVAKEHQLSKADLAKILGKDPSRITRIFGEPSNLELSTIVEVFVALGVDPRSILAESGSPRPTGGDDVDNDSTVPAIAARTVSKAAARNAVPAPALSFVPGESYAGAGLHQPPTSHRRHGVAQLMLFEADQRFSRPPQDASRLATTPSAEAA